MKELFKIKNTRDVRLAYTLHTGKYWKHPNTVSTPSRDYVKWLQDLIIEGGFVMEEVS